MGKTFSADKIYFDEGTAGISSGASHDNGLHWDTANGGIINATMPFSLVNQEYFANEVLNIDMKMDFSVIENYSSFIDLMELVPLKFRNSELLQQFLYEGGLLAGTWLGNINDIQSMLDKYKVGDKYIQFLADLINLKFVGKDISLENKRRQLVQAIDWYKMKGTYGALIYIAYVLNITLNKWDMYTNDYVTFIREPWFTGLVGENPPDLDSTYYKSPHIGIEVVLNKVYGTLPHTYLFRGDLFGSISAYLELARPVNTVPHFTVLLSPETTTSGGLYVSDGNIQSVATGNWSYVKAYFDGDNALTQIVDSAYNEVVDSLGNLVVSTKNYFDNGIVFDQATDAFLNSISKFKIGTGNKNISPSVPGFALENVVYSGDITSVKILVDRAEYRVELPNTLNIVGISELGLFLPDGTTMKVASTFPDIDLTSDMGLRIVVTVYFAAPSSGVLDIALDTIVDADGNTIII